MVDYEDKPCHHELQPLSPLNDGKHMSARSVTIPFKVPGLIAGFADGRGLAKASPSELSLEFVIKENLLAIFKTGIREIRIPYSEIDLLQHTPGWFADKLRIRVRSLRLLSDLPGCDNGEVTLHIRRRDRSQIEDLVHLMAQSH